jgi:hypothetical protein
VNQPHCLAIFHGCTDYGKGENINYRNRKALCPGALDVPLPRESIHKNTSYSVKKVYLFATPPSQQRIVPAEPFTHAMRARMWSQILAAK